MSTLGSSMPSSYFGALECTPATTPTSAPPATLASAPARAPTITPVPRSSASCPTSTSSSWTITPTSLHRSWTWSNRTPCTWTLGSRPRRIWPASRDWGVWHLPIGSVNIRRSGSWTAAGWGGWHAFRKQLGVDVPQMIYGGTYLGVVAKESRLTLDQIYHVMYRVFSFYFKPPKYSWNVIWSPLSPSQLGFKHHINQIMRNKHRNNNQPSTVDHKPEAQQWSHGVFKHKNWG